MPRTVVGLFDDLRTAGLAEQALEKAGLLTEHLVLAGSALRSALAAEGAPVTDRGDGVRMLGPDVVDALERFGVPRDKAERYAAAVQRGGAAIVLRDLDDEAAERASQVFLDHRPVDPERRLSAYHDSGYAGYAPTAHPFAADETAAERNPYADEHHGEVDVIYVM